MSTMTAIREHIASLPAGKPFVPSQLAGLGTRASIDMALSRLVKVGHLERIGRGVYTLAKKSKYGFKVMPSSEEVVQTVAEAKNETIELHGAEAVRLFGFTTQAPLRPIYYTSGSSRSLKLGELKIKMQHTAQRKLALAGRPAGHALSALWYLGKEQVTPSTFARLAEKLPASEFQVLCEAKSSMPAWMVSELNKYEREMTAHG